jgi:hypothetical protein
MTAPLVRLAAFLRDEGGLLGQAATEPGAAASPHVESAGGERAYAVAAIREGYELHGGGGRVVATPDPDLALLAGDRLYALGLAELAAAGDLAGVRAMAEVIAASAAARGAGDEQAAEAAWEQGIAGLGRPDEPPRISDR